MMIELNEQEIAAAKEYSAGDSSQIAALAIVLARRIGWHPLAIVRELNDALKAVRAVRVG